ncbi:MAG: 30S ribosomal protein S9 [Candidatus Vogelbacteria bacterium CG10_big_fil_rev_8_21_14_0_10_45_14]|uniref:Small ribosomal subunit protein uS9 n=1 Tax=Candidatus Vogelbacteria bacterium CG10_big_fil_rev_8_21_14_0_10_45_14 TaxID=1975042 RepID=A0A2H0RN41_9BACT|nr:MAG: 30S ribosomal protein S9 [Candidatus Vogelbacteria bacterium CG10_big_fil_rev_8_21_14_0_10_45_14]
MPTPTKVEKTKYIEGIGRRKCAVARVRIVESSKESFVVNGVSLDDYFKTQTGRNTSRAPLKIAVNKKPGVSVVVRGGGIASQAEAISLGLARALQKSESELRAPLKKAGLLSRDSRIKERRKFGLKKARKSPQWSKR